MTARPEPRNLDVLGKARVTPNMLRITLGGPGLTGFPADQISAYIKLRLKDAQSGRDVVRTYTVRHHREGEIDVDFALHEPCGPATSWALNAQVGDSVLVGGPGPRKLVHADADWFLLVGDMTALPAISGNIEMLPRTARGMAVIEVIAQSDIEDLETPTNFTIDWVVNPHPGQSSALLLERVRRLDWPEGNPSVWAACEFSSMRALRDYFRSERNLTPSNLYISSYWKAGSDEDAHKIAKRKDATVTA
ncbi:MAG: siderophore-interacting protein [Hoeflea sp.]|uniref:siderophore-interacting protein n=1 Tax=Hoeflea sp. TaxID=1940281 RepID=UPI001DDA3522|nr:siderophore-interacting protein [Hoeflea sp.]MBU4529742.1 siderophore-interacting protein [Alphaproteobacteria bacterium]MBU4543303.1 siderophore-interacting protein [Alphaproteobacteria bacterium]MBU4552490.1 siderophore-interacting protein [Alphaproteobacteria bacterium]MBV1723506.1 siderophore-interacting protein [Hoeflea sp.]MBV1762955.1 siderophore-interacting protein [Hoeflea sp.]